MSLTESIHEIKETLVHHKLNGVDNNGLIKIVRKDSNVGCDKMNDFLERKDFLEPEKRKGILEYISNRIFALSIVEDGLNLENEFSTLTKSKQLVRKRLVKYQTEKKDIRYEDLINKAKELSDLMCVAMEDFVNTDREGIPQMKKENLSGLANMIFALAIIEIEYIDRKDAHY